MAATSLAEQQLAEIPLLRDGRPTNSSGRSLISTILGWLQKGVKAAFCVHDDGNAVVFLGDDGKLFELHCPEGDEDEDGATADMPSPSEIFHGSEAWKLPDDTDLSAVCITSTCNRYVFLVDSQMRLFSKIAAEGLSRCLTNHHVAQVACGCVHVLVLTTDGVVHSSGVNYDGQLGLGHADSVEIPDMRAVRLNGFATSVACGAEHSVVILCKGQVAAFGRLGRVWESNTPVELESPVGPPVKAACGAQHTLLLTAGGRLAGFGSSYKNPLGKLGHSDTLKKVPFKSANGRPVDIFCDWHSYASVVLTETDDLYVCGDVGALFNSKRPIPTFRHYQKPAVILRMSDDDEKVAEEEEQEEEGFLTMICIRLPTGRVMIPGFNDPELCDIEVVPADSTGQLELPGGQQAALELAAKFPRDSKRRRLVECSVSEGVALLPSDVHREHQDCGTPESHGSAPLVTQPSPSQSVFISLHAIRARSRYLWTILQSELTGDISQTEGRKKQLRLSKYSPKVLEAYGRFLHEDVVVTDASGAIELLELAREYGDENGLPEQCARAAKRLVREKDLPLCLRKCIELHHMALAVDLVKLQLSVENCCDVLQVAEMGSSDDPYAEYIRDIAMEFALAHVEEVVNSARYKYMDGTVQGRMLSRLYAK